MASEYTLRLRAIQPPAARYIHGGSDWFPPCVLEPKPPVPAKARKVKYLSTWAGAHEQRQTGERSKSEQRRLRRIWFAHPFRMAKMVNALATLPCETWDEVRATLIAGERG